MIVYRDLKHISLQPFAQRWLCLRCGQKQVSDLHIYKRDACF